MARAASTLETYRTKRDFRSTAEPAPDAHVARPAGQLGRFVIQKHDARRLHFDFRLELDGVLKSWAVMRGPSLDPSDKRLAVRTEDHPLAYEEFEGTIPQGEYGGGTVMLWDQGTWLPRGDPHDGLEKGVLKFELSGKRLHGGFALVRLGRKPRDMRENWLLIKERDAFAERDGNVADRWWSSVESGRSMEGIAAAPSDGAAAGARNARRGRRTSRRGRVRAHDRAETDEGEGARRARGGVLPAFVRPQLAQLVKEAPEGECWLHEIKFDGYRAVAALNGADVRIFTRSGLDWTARFYDIAQTLAGLSLKGMLLDGEIVVLDAAGRSRFGLLQQRLKAGSRAKGHGELVYFVFDCLFANGRDLRGEPLSRRKQMLAALLKSAPPSVRLSTHVAGHGTKVFAEACAMGLEGIVSKRADARYVSVRSSAWLKAKCVGRDEFVVIGFRPTKAAHRPFSSLILGAYEGSALVYRGRVGAGFDAKDLTRIWPALRGSLRATTEAIAVPADVARHARWVRPRLVAEVSYTETTEDGVLRHPVFLGLREDKRPGEVVMPRHAAGEGALLVGGVRLTHPDKVLFADSALSKAALAEYLLAVSGHMLPHLSGRPLSFVRCPDGDKRGCFFQKHFTRGMPPELAPVEVAESDGERACYVGINSAEGLVAAAQVGALELHIWGARADQIERPDRLVFDLDPDEALPFAVVRRAAFDVRDLLATLGLTTFAMLTGGKGLHVVAPIERRHDWATVKGFAQGFAVRLAQDDAGRFVANMAKARRRGRIFIDYLRNERGATAIAPYSARAKARASVALPVSWDALRRIERADLYTIPDVLRRLKTERDPWAGYLDVRQRLSAKALRFFAP